MSVLGASLRPMIRRVASIRSCWIVALVVAFSSALATSPAHGEVVASEHAASPIAAFESYAAWSRADGRRFRLIIWHDGRLHRAAVAPRAAQFDVDLGRNAAGRVVAVYSRCTKTKHPLPGYMPFPADNEGCDLYQYDLTSQRERRLRGPSTKGSSEFLPAIAGRRLVFARLASPRSSQASFPQLVSATLGHHYRERLLPRPTSHATREGSIGPRTIDARGSVAAIGWEYEPKQNACQHDEKGTSPLAQQVVFYDLATATSRVLDDDCRSSARGSQFASPSLEGDNVFYPCAVDVPGSNDGAWAVRTFAPAADAGPDVIIPGGVDAYVDSSQTAGGWTWVVIEGGEPSTISVQRFQSQPA